MNSARRSTCSEQTSPTELQEGTDDATATVPGSLVEDIVRWARQEVLLRRSELEAGNAISLHIRPWLPGIEDAVCKTVENRVLRTVSRMVSGVTWTWNKGTTEMQVHVANACLFKRTIDSLTS